MELLDRIKFISKVFLGILIFAVFTQMFVIFENLRGDSVNANFNYYNFVILDKSENFSYLNKKKDKMYAESADTDFFQQFELIYDLNTFVKPKPVHRIVKYSPKEFEMMTYTVELEAHEKSLKHKELVAQVIVNRLYHPNFKENTLEKILKAKRQFAGMKNYYSRKFAPDADTLSACKNALNGRLDIPENLLYFYNRAKSKAKYHKFFESKDLTYELEGHRFFTE